MKEYEELSGGLGPTVAYRAQRHLVRELVRDNAARLSVHGVGYPLYDLTMSGVSFLLPPDHNPGAVNDVVGIDIRLHDLVLYRGRARIVREDRSFERCRVALQLLDGFLDLHAMQRADQDRWFDLDLTDGPERALARVDPSYRAVLLEAVHFLSFYERSLGAHEARAAESGSPELVREALARRAIERIRPRWNDLCRRAAEAALPLRSDRSANAAARAATELLLTPHLLAAPVLARSYRKPLGYAGDFTVMTHIYANAFEGASAYGQVLHKLACEEPLAAGVRTRKDLVRDTLAEEYARKRGAPFRALSLGCGPAREVVEFLQGAPAPVHNVHWTLIDQEERALSVAHHDVLRAQAHDEASSLRCLYLSFEQLLRRPDGVRGEPQDFIYCVGLFDYLRKPQAEALLGELYRRLVPGGSLAVGNACAPNTHFWLAEFGTDWTLLYRTPEELAALGGALGARCAVRRETSGAYDFLIVTKPDAR